MRLIQEPFFFEMDRKEGERIMNKNKKTQKFVAIGMLSSIAYVLMMLNFPIPIFPSFLLIDFSELPALIAAIVFGPLAGIAVEAIKNFLYYAVQGSMTGVPVGSLANFIAGVLYIVPVALMFRKFRNRKSITLGLTVGTILTSIVMSILNYYVILPAYTWFLQAPAMSDKMLYATVTTAIFPFNIVKGAIVGVLFGLMYAKMHTWIAKRSIHPSTSVSK
ncbi:ECF transporter S component [Priestia filamentosa]|nr:ECF transporter S component [Priestia filamentosa]SMF07493.1 Riboflavin transporter FmnP [Priestia filamentosa]